MLARTLCYALIGVDGIPVTVETDVSGGTFKQVVVGLPDTAVKESTERVLAGLRNSGYAFPQGRVTVNLAPADVRKEGSAFDLSIALSLLAASRPAFESPARARIAVCRSCALSISHHRHQHSAFFGSMQRKTKNYWTKFPQCDNL